MTSPAEVVLDTSAWLAIVRGEVAVESRLQEAHSVLAHLALAEILALEARGKISGDMNALHDLLAGARREAMTEEDARAAAPIHARNRAAGGKASLVDCILLALARRIGAPLLTTDNDLRGEKGVVVLARK
jgi:predicted nucleic acid-binding protein